MALTRSSRNVYKNFATTLNAPTPQMQPLRGREAEQVKNEAGGYAWPVTDMTRLERFLCIGTESGTYYTDRLTLTKENAEATIRAIKTNGQEAVRLIRHWSETGRAPRNSPALFALALASADDYADRETRALAFEGLPAVARTLSFLYEYTEYVSSFRGWGRGLRNGVSAWFEAKSDDDLLFQALKYRQRNGWSVRDLLRSAHPLAANADRQAVYDYLAHGATSAGVQARISAREGGWGRVWAYERVRQAKNLDEVLGLVRDYRLSWEMVPTEYHGNPEFWRAVLPQLPPNALLRNLARLTANGTFAPLASDVDIAVAKLTNKELLTNGRVHPMNVLTTLKHYSLGRSSGKSAITWVPNPRIMAALDAAYYAAFASAPPLDQRVLVAVDVSGSMTHSQVLGTPNMTAAEAAAAIAMLFLRTAKNAHPIGFDQKIYDLNISARSSMREVLDRISNLSGNGTDCALPMVWARQANVRADAFVLVTDGQTWAGNIHPAHALQEYRRATGIPAKLFVIYTAATATSLADPKDGGSAVASGFDARLPLVVNAFLGGASAPSDEDEV